MRAWALTVDCTHQAREARLATKYRSNPRSPGCVGSQSTSLHVLASDILHDPIASNQILKRAAAVIVIVAAGRARTHSSLHLKVSGRSHRSSKSLQHHHDLINSIEAPCVFHSDFVAAAYIEARLPKCCIRSRHFVNTCWSCGLEVHILRQFKSRLLLVCTPGSESRGQFGTVLFPMRTFLASVFPVQVVSWFINHKCE